VGRPLFRYLRRALTESKDWPRVLTLSGLLQVFGLALPLINGRLIDLVIPHNDGHMLLVLLVGLVTLIAFQFVTMFVRSHLLVNIRTILDAKMTLGFMDHMLSLPYAFFQRRQAGDLMMRLNSNAQIREILTSGVASGAIDGILVVAYLGLVIFMSPPVALVALCLVGAQAVVFFYFRKRQILLMSGMQQKQAEGDSQLVELLSGIETLKATGHEQRTAQRWSNVYVDIMNLTMGRGRMSAWTDALLHVVSVMSPFIILVVGTLEVMKGHLTLGAMMSVTAFANGFISPVSNLVATFWQFQLVGVYLARIEDVLSTPKEQTRADLRLAPKLTGRISLEGVSFRYGPKSPLVVRDVSLEVPPGRVVAIVGRSGSGKSTLASLLCGLYTPAAGTIRYDGMDLADLDLSSVRRQLGIVIQKPYVFGTSIRTNITMGDPDVPLDDVIAAARLAALHDEIAAMPLGYDTPLTAGGASLSGGQRQRIALARALLRRPSIMLLDEATSALDNVTERTVKDNLAGLGCTRVVIAHRLSTIRNADVILVMEDGRLVEQGTHAALLAARGAYQRLCQAEDGVASPAVDDRRLRLAAG
jgi:ABC-type bacteriocin/lantibiotic exporter with double-glycine peptidase domain